MSKWAKKGREPKGFEYIRPVMDALENELREKMNEPHENKRKCEALWPIHQINWQRSRYVYDLYYKHKRISREVYDYCVKNKLVDAPLIAKWKKPGYERLCSTYAINTKNYNFGTVSICRVPKHSLAEGTIVEDKHSGCRGCASGPGGRRNIFGNKYGQYLAAIQVAREKKQQVTKEDISETNVWAASEGTEYTGEEEETNEDEEPTHEEEETKSEEKSEEEDDNDDDSEDGDNEEVDHKSKKPRTE